MSGLEKKNLKLLKTNLFIAVSVELPKKSTQSLSQPLMSLCNSSWETLPSLFASQSLNSCRILLYFSSILSISTSEKATAAVVDGTRKKLSLPQFLWVLPWQDSELILLLRCFALLKNDLVVSSDKKTLITMWCRICSQLKIKCLKFSWAWRSRRLLDISFSMSFFMVKKITCEDWLLGSFLHYSAWPLSTKLGVVELWWL